MTTLLRVLPSLLLAAVSPALAANKGTSLPPVNAGSPLVPGAGTSVVLPQISLGAGIPQLATPLIPAGAPVIAVPAAQNAAPSAQAQIQQAARFSPPQDGGGENASAQSGASFDGGAKLPEVSVSQPGALTMQKLETFTITGPRPSERGLPFLLAQGAKSVAKSLTQAWSAVTGRRKPVSGAVREVGTLVRREGKTSVIVQHEGGKPTWVEVPSRLAQGVVTGSLVEVNHTEGGEAGAVRAIGTKPMDMVIGRVVQRGGQLMLESLFKDEGMPLSGYEPMPLNPANLGVSKGAIVQAYVKPVNGGFKAEALVDLGAKITPEIAAREAALRQGGRGHLDEELIVQAEKAGREYDAAAEFAKLNERLRAKGLPEAQDLRKHPFLTIDPIGAGDLDDAYYVVEHEDGSTTWYLATADVARLVRPGTEAFRSAIGKGNTFYTIDKDGVPEYPMIHPVISKDKASLIGGQDRMAVITTMRFGPDGEFLQDESSVGLGIVHVQGRYTYDQVVELWEGKKDHGIAHLEQVELARKLARKLHDRDSERGKLQFNFLRAQPMKTPEGWKMVSVRESELEKESHRLIEELKVYGNRVIARHLSALSKEHGVPHISRVHQPQDEKRNEKLRQDLRKIGAPWEGGPISDYLLELQKRRDLSPELKDLAQTLVLTSRSTAKFSADDGLGHEGLALGSDEYDQPSAGIRRGADLINLLLLEAALEGGDPAALYAEMTKDFETMGLTSIEQVAEHLTQRQLASKQMGNEVRDFMALYELSKPEHWNKPLKGYVSYVRQRGRERDVVVQLREPSVQVKLTGDEAEGLDLLSDVELVVHGVNLSELRLDRTVVGAGRRARHDAFGDRDSDRRSRRDRRNHRGRDRR